MVNSTREEAAVYAADGYARERGLGAAAVTFGVGALAGAAALGGSNAERVPVVLIAGAPGLGERDGRRLHHTPGDDIDAPRRALAQVVGETLVLDDLETALEDLECALDRCAHDHRPLYLELPRDLLDERPAARRRRPAAAHRAASPERIAAGVADVRDRLSAARRPVVWSGVGILRRGRGAEVLALAERHGRAGRRVGHGQGRRQRAPPPGGRGLLRRVLGRRRAAHGRAGRPGARARRGHQRHQHGRLHARRPGGAPHPGRPHRPAGGLPRLPGRDPRRPRSTASSGARCAAGGRRPGCRAPGPGAAARGRASPATSSPSGSRGSCARRTSSSATSGWPPTC